MMSTLPLILRRQVICIAGILLIFLLGTQGVARAIMFSIAPGSPAAGTFSTADILTSSLDGSLPTVAFTAASLGLVAGDDIDALSFGSIDPLGSPVFSVDPAAVGFFPFVPPDVSTEATAGQAAGDIYVGLFLPVPPPGANTLVVNQKELGLFPLIDPGVANAATPIDNLDAGDADLPGSADTNHDGTPDIAIYFSLAAGSPSLLTGGALFGFGAADIFSTFGGVSGLALSAAAMGLGATDDIDALLYDGVTSPLFSLAPGSASLGAFSAADVLTPIVSFPFLAPVFGPSVGTLGLVAGDNLNVFDQAQEPIPEPTTMALLGIGLAGLGGRYLKRRRKQRADA